jgi:hypothetical protein
VLSNCFLYLQLSSTSLWGGGRSGGGGSNSGLCTLENVLEFPGAANKKTVSGYTWVAKLLPH